MVRRRRGILLALVAVVIAGVLGRHPHAQSPAVVATIQAVSDCTGLPVAGADVSANGAYVGQTDATGQLAGQVYVDTTYALTLDQGQFQTWHGAFTTEGPIRIVVGLHAINPSGPCAGMSYGPYPGR